ncbi:hemagglutinin repeat-containing protein, partial [Vreelandella zhaodongensis]|uniref:hemagglutinin repeat-containing protein n=1 Tax=Vreelandella zhaodongensis TaxID=1176240 RepID=UPI00361A35EA
TIAAADNLTIDSASVTSSGTLAAGLNSDGSLNTLDANGAALRVTTSGDLSATGTNLAAGTLTLNGDNVDLSGSQTSAYHAIFSAQGDLDIRAAAIVTQDSLSLHTAGALDNTEGTLSSQAGDLSVKALSLNNEKGSLLAGNDLKVSLSETLINTNGSVYAGGSATLDTGALVNTGTIATVDDLTIDATSVDSSGSLAAGLNQDGTLKTFADGSGALNITTINDIAATGINLAAGNLTLKGDNVDLSESQTSAYSADIAARGDLDTWEASIVSQNNLSLYADGALDNTKGTLFSHQGDLNAQARSLNNEQATLLAGNDVSVVFSEALNNADGTVYAGGNATLDVNALTNTGTIAAADNLTIDAGSVASSGTLAAGLKSDGSLNTFDANGTALRVITSGDLSATGTNLAAGSLILGGDHIDLSESQTSAYRTTVTARGDLKSGKANVVTQENLTLQAKGALDNTAGTLSSQAGDLSVKALSLNNEQGSLLADNNLAVLGEALNNTDGTIYAGGNASLDVDVLTNAGTVAAANDLIIDSTSVDSTGTLAAGLNSDGNLAAFDTNGAELRITATDHFSATGNNLAAGHLTLESGNVNLSNSQTSANSAAIVARGELHTDNAALISHSDIDIDAQSLNNMGGTVYAGNNATLDTGVLTNTGTIAGAHNLIIDANSIESSGTLAAGMNQDGTLKESAQGSGVLSVIAIGDLSSSGTNLAAGRLTLDANNIDLSGSQTSAYNADIVARGDLTTWQANVVTEEELSLRAAGAIDNKDGVLASKAGSLMSNANGVTNTGGLMVAATELGIEANSNNINNISGDILSQGDMSLSTHADILNTGGIVQSNAAISLSADTVNNRQTGEDTQGIVGDDVQITASFVDNTEGQVLAGRDLTITADRFINNTHGKINAQRHLNLQDGVPGSDTLPGERNLVISNVGGEIVANNDIAPAAASITITAKTLGLDGTMESGGDMSLDLVGDLNTAADQQVRTEGVLSLRLHGEPSGNTFNNAGKWEGGRGLAIRADEIRNQASGELRSRGVTALDAVQTTNRGLIDGADTRINSHKVDNVGTGRLYGDHIAIAANHLSNREETVGGQTKAATIAARERLDVGAQHITNREGALIFSGGDMAIGGSLFSNYQAVADGTGNAATLNNNSATIESLGDMVLAADTLRNTNEHFAITEEYLGETTLTLIQPEGWSTKLNKEDLVWHEGDVRPEGGQYDPIYTWDYQGKDFSGFYAHHTDSGVSIIRRWTQYVLNRKEHESRVVSSAPSQIMAGGYLGLRGQHILNDKSRIIVGRTLYGDTGNLENREALGERRVSDEGSAQKTNPQGTSFSGPDGFGGIHYTRRQWHAPTSYNPPDEVTTINLGVGEIRQNTAVSGTGVSIGGKADLGTASGVSTGSTDATGSALADQSASHDTQEVAKASNSINAVNTETHGVSETTFSANRSGDATNSTSAVSTDAREVTDTSFKANHSGSVVNSADSVNTETYRTSETSFSANSPGSVHSTNGVDTDAHGVTGASFSANNSGNVTNSANVVNTETHRVSEAAFSANEAGNAASSVNAVNTDAYGATGTSFSANDSGNATSSANAVNTETHGAAGTPFSANKPGNATNSANVVNTDAHGQTEALFSANRPSNVTNSANAVNTDAHGQTGASFNANSSGDATRRANAVNTETHGAAGTSFSANSSGNVTNSTNAVNTGAHGQTGASFSANGSGDATRRANAVNTETHGAAGTSFSANSSGNVTNSTNAVNTDVHGATEASFSTNTNSATHSTNGVNTDIHGTNGASLTVPSSSSTTQGSAALPTGNAPVDHASASEGAQATAGLGTQSAPAVLLPTSSLFTIDPGSNARYLVATDPDFTDHRQWLSSDYLLSALAYDPAHAQKRLGDGFYEQKLIRDQVAALTGYRFLGDYRTDDAQYAALMNAGATFAHEHKLRPGIALSASQTAQLTNDIVWLVTQTVQLPDGSTTTALMPKVYLAPREGDLATNGELLGGHNGTLISARDIDLALSGDLNNSGTIAGRNLVDISAQNLNNSGRIQGDIALIDARQDINIDGGSIAATTGMALQAGGDINIASTLHSATNEVDGNTFSLQGIDRVAGLYVNGEAGNLLASAGGAINLTAAELHNIGSGVTQLTAGSDINLDTLEVGQSHALNWDANNYHHQSHSEEIGSVITGGGAVSLTAGQDINLRAATVDAQGALALNAIGGDITLQAGQRMDSLAEGHSSSSGGLFSSRTRTTRTSSINTQALASELGGQTVTMTSGQDIHLSGANVLADQDLGIHAGGNLTLDAEQTTLSESHFSDSRKSGLFSGGFGINIGSQRQESDAQSTATFVAPTTVGSIGGNVTLSAGDTYTQIGSDVLAPSGDILIGANTVNILEGRETRSSQTEQRFKQSGLSLSLSSPVIDSGQRLQGQAQAAGDTQSPRMQALAAANSALAVTDIQQQLQSGQGTDLSLNISLGSSQSRSNSTVESNTARGSTLAAGGNLAIHALGQGEGEGSLTVQGSQLEAGDQLLLNATQDINLLASADAVSQRDSHNSSSGSIGLGFGTNGIALNLDASRAKGHGNGDSTFFNNTQLSAGNQVILNSGGDTALKGAVVSAPQISTNIGGDLTIESLQDTATHNERHQSSGGSLSVPLIGVGQPTASLNASRTKLNSDFQSVNEQSGLRAGDGGFQVNVGGTTNLTGGAITSTDVAIDDDLNTFTTAGQTASEALESGVLTLTDLANNATFDAESTSVGLSSGGNDSGESSFGLSGIGTGRDDGSASSTTESAISGLAGNQDARTGDADTGIAPIFDADNVRKDVQAQATITQEFGSRASKLVGDTAQAKLEEAQLKRLQAQQ